MPDRPNILYIMSDDHGSAAISSYGSVINRTPHIDRLAAQGVRLNNTMCTNAICTPSRATILSGQYSHVNDVKTLADELDSSRPLPDAQHHPLYVCRILPDDHVSVEHHHRLQIRL